MSGRRTSSPDQPARIGVTRCREMIRILPPIDETMIGLRSDDNQMMDLFFGGRRLVFETPLTLEDATKRLQNEIAAPKWRVYENRQQSFIGTFADGRFHVIRLVGGRNSFRPIIDGQLSASSNGCRVEVRLKMPAVAVVACVLFVMIGVTIMAVALSRPAATDKLLARYFALIGSLMLGMSLVIPTVEARKATRILATLFQSEPVPSTS